jgi:hypothetical protein
MTAEIKTDNILVIYRDGQIVRLPWRIKAHGQPTDDSLRRYLRKLTVFASVERAVVYDRQTLRAQAMYLRSVIPTNDQERLIERIGAREGVTAIICDPQASGDVLVVYKHHDWTYDTVIHRHPTVKEMVYS